jgi:hypothetical protein
MPADVSGDFAATCGVTDVDCILQAERFDQGRQVVGVRVHVVAAPGLARSSMSAAIMGDAAVPVGAQEQHLVLPRIRVRRPTVAEDQGLTVVPVLVVDLRTVFRRNRTHRVPSIFRRASPTAHVRPTLALIEPTA